MTYVELALKKADLEKVIKSSLKIRDDFQFKIGRNTLTLLCLDMGNTSMLYITTYLSKRKNTDAMPKQSITVKRRDTFAMLKLLKLAKRDVVSLKINTKEERLTVSANNIAMTVPCEIKEIKSEPNPYKIKTDNCQKFDKDFLQILKTLSSIGDIMFLGFDDNLFLFTISDMIKYNALSYLKLKAQNHASPYFCLISSDILRNIFTILNRDEVTIASKNVEYPLTFKQKTDTMIIRYSIAPRIFEDAQIASEFLDRVVKHKKIPQKWYKTIPQLLKS